MTGERGSVTFWVLGLTVAILGFGGIALDFWRAIAVQREIAAIADAATVAAASGIDEAHYRATGELVLSPERAVRLGEISVASQSADLDSVELSISPDGSEVSIEVVARVEGIFIGMFTGDGGWLDVRVTSSASPVLIP